MMKKDIRQKISFADNILVLETVLVTHNPKLAAQSQVFYHLNDGGVLDAPIRRSEDPEGYYQ